MVNNKNNKNKSTDTKSNFVHTIHQLFVENKVSINVFFLTLSIISFIFIFVPISEFNLLLKNTFIYNNFSLFGLISTICLLSFLIFACISCTLFYNFSSLKRNYENGFNHLNPRHIEILKLLIDSENYSAVLPDEKDLIYLCNENFINKRCTNINSVINSNAKSIYKYTITEYWLIFLKDEFKTL